MITIDQIRSELAKLDAAWKDMPEIAQQTTDAQRERYEKAAFDMRLNLATKLHLLLDKIDDLAGGYEE